MMLASGVSFLNDEIKAAYIKARDAGAQDAADSNLIIQMLAGDLTAAIHKYMETAVVKTSDTIVPGQSSSGPFGLGFYSTPGTGTGVGSISFKSPDVQTLQSEIEAALRKVRTNGSARDVNFESIVSTLATDMKTSIHKFSLTAKVDTDIILAGGAVVTGYLTTTAPPVPLPSVSGPGKGKGSGFLS